MIEQRNIFENMPDGVIIHKNVENNIDVKANIQFINQTIYQMFVKNGIKKNNDPQNQKSLINRINLKKTEYVIKM